MSQSPTDKEAIFLTALAKASNEKKVPPKYLHILQDFFHAYKKIAMQSHTSIEEVVDIFTILLREIIKNCKKPFSFQPYHSMVTSPFDYHAFGLRFVLPLVDLKNSTVVGWENVKKIDAFLQKKENVVLFANHQTETDPQVIDILLKDQYPTIAKEMIFVAGERVLADPAAIPFSMGRNLLCIYSKKYIATPPELKQQKQAHNQKTMRTMGSLLEEGGKIIYVAPSGGRDRRNNKGEVIPAPFDEKSIELFYLIARKAKNVTHFFPLALKSYDLLPPPEGIQQELGEERKTNFSPIFLSFNEEIDMENFPGSEKADKTNKKRLRTEHIFTLVKEAYSKI